MNDNVLFVTRKDSWFDGPIRRAFFELDFHVISGDYRSLRSASWWFLIPTFPFILPIFLFVSFFGRGRFVLEFFVNLHLLSLALFYRPRFLFTIKGETLQPWFLKLVRGIHIKTVNWYPDDAFQLSRIKTFAQLFDLLFTFDPYLLRQLRSEGYTNVYYLPFATESRRALKRTKDRYGVVFIGQPDPTREKILLSIADLGLHLWGGWENTKLACYVQSRFVPPKEVEKIYADAAITLNIHSHSFQSEKDRLTEGTNLRTFVVTGVGAFLLTEYRKDVENLFAVGKEVEVFRSRGELREKIEYYLSHPSERHRIAQGGFQRTRRDHTYLQRIKTIVERVDALS